MKESSMNGIMGITAEDKKRLLIQRGFTEEEIINGLSEYIVNEKVWSLSSEEITPELIAKTHDLNDLKRLFEKDSIRNGICPEPPPNYDFKQYLERPWRINSSYVNAATIEPYVARIALAINTCGIYTIQSCDKWHSDYSREDMYSLWLFFADVYSCAWFKVILMNVLGEKEENSKFCIDYYYSRNKPGKVLYKRINQYAEFFEVNRESLLAIRDKWMGELKNKESQKNMEDLAKHHKLDECILKYVRSDLKGLKNEWAKIKDRKTVGIQCWDFC